MYFPLFSFVLIKQGECQINFSAQHFSNIFLRNNKSKKNTEKFLWLLEAHAKEYFVINAVVENFSRICGGFNILFFFGPLLVYIYFFF